jgi:hypothetical protein
MDATIRAGTWGMKAEGSIVSCPLALAAAFEAPDLRLMENLQNQANVRAGGAERRVAQTNIPELVSR